MYGFSCIVVRLRVMLIGYHETGIHSQTGKLHNAAGMHGSWPIPGWAPVAALARYHRVRMQSGITQRIIGAVRYSVFPLNHLRYNVSDPSWTHLNPESEQHRSIIRESPAFKPNQIGAWRRGKTALSGSQPDLGTKLYISWIESTFLCSIDLTWCTWAGKKEQMGGVDIWDHLICSNAPARLSRMQISIWIQN